jgi:hypothetical protein
LYQWGAKLVSRAKMVSPRQNSERTKKKRKIKLKNVRYDKTT